MRIVVCFVSGHPSIVIGYSEDECGEHMSSGSDEGCAMLVSGHPSIVIGIPRMNAESI
jgi:hypothetical protein